MPRNDIHIGAKCKHEILKATLLIFDRIIIHTLVHLFLCTQRQSLL